MNKDAQKIASLFDAIKQRGGHAAIDYRNGELALICTRPSADHETWGRGAVPQSFTDDWVRLCQC